MLIDNKFIYLSLPRCASTSFHYSCILNNLDVKTCDDGWTKENSNIDFTKINKVDIMNYIYHGHESLTDLQLKFGSEFPIIAVRRERHERFFSLYKHILSDFKRFGLDDFYDLFSKLTVDELFFFTKNDLLTKKSIWTKIFTFLVDRGLFDKNMTMDKVIAPMKKRGDYYRQDKNLYIINILEILLTPISTLTNNSNKIIWFDFNRMGEMEEWVSNITRKPFKLESVNSSKHIECRIEFNDEFIMKYDEIYDFYDLQKEKITLI
jgi:hypothetical protein